MKRQELKEFVHRNLAAENRTIDIIRTGAKDLKTVVITYQSKDGTITERETEPYDISNGKYWGYCLSSQGIRQFTIGNILTLYVTDTNYRPRWPVKIY